MRSYRFRPVNVLSILLLLLIFTTIAAKKKELYNSKDFLIQGFPIIGTTSESHGYWGGGVKGNFFANRYFSFQMFAGGGKNWAELDYSAILVPLGILSTGSDKAGDVLTGILLVASAISSPVVHIPIAKTFDVAISLHTFRQRWYGEDRFAIVGGGGVAFNSIISKHFNIGLLSEMSVSYEKDPIVDGRLSLAVGWLF